MSTIFGRTISIPIFLGLLSGAAGAEKTLRLATDGIPEATIVLADKPSPAAI